MKLVFLSSMLLATFGTSAWSQTNIRKVDFKNFKYRLSCGGADKVSSVVVKKGRYTGGKGSIDPVYLQITDVFFGDLNGDRKEEAVVLYSCGSGASYVYIWGLVFTLEGNRPVLITDIEGGNKGDGGFHDVKIVNGRLIVERYELGVAGIGPVAIVRTRYTIRGKQLKQIGRQTTRPVNLGPS